MTTPQQIQPGARVKFEPKNPALNWAAGIRTVKCFDMESGSWKLECGNIKLLARFEELTLLSEK